MSAWDNHPAGIPAINWKLLCESAVSRADKAEAAVAEMRAAIETPILGKEFGDYILEQFPQTSGHRPILQFIGRLRSALSSDCGKGWVSPEKVKELEDRLAASHTTICLSSDKIKTLVQALESITNCGTFQQADVIARQALASIQSK